MIKSLVMASYTYFDGTFIGDMLTQWNNAGFFQYLLPFLLIFALVFGILDRIGLFKTNKSISPIIALVVGLMALQFPMVSQFFAELFPRLGIALSIILIIMILLGLFLNSEGDSDPVKWVLLSTAAIILVIVLVKTAGALGWSSGWWWSDNWPVVAGVVIILAAIGIIVGASSDKTFGKNVPFYMKS